MQTVQTTPQQDRPEQESRAVEQVERLCAQLEAAEGVPVPLQELARTAGLSPWATHRLFKRVTGITPRDYAQALREGACAANCGAAATSRAPSMKRVMDPPAGSTKARTTRSA
ncbi:hypothetical protein [Fodinicurvata halophila]|uniref:hypothetical protein n=1 Tax=Fodinicurvata halophila TaxID=1419723 RepID=UPI003624B8EA